MIVPFLQQTWKNGGDIFIPGFLMVSMGMPRLGPAWRILTLLIPFANAGFGVNILLTINPRFMASSPKPVGPKSNLAKDLWINPHSNLRGPDGDRAWDNLGNISPQGGARFLELADIALGLKRSAIKKKKAIGAGAHQTDGKTEP